ncbi:hypothetical protein A2363_01810 [Candidatus Gottesmanbacteria bacterium RIFOXYB1_FULL_47_11]|uniref:Excalibur calcium-binding domain-containing protein n=1 Tax=Candidatus Gottesmanbacteria bacterium RIFOXYB1_FULL_47_11 TaxID=1798401 RepID=A0A1F6BEI9_9BACT|nr:MAG: hypothetical protein A2363_01810 [Candidatus Gottesmanbacteria bacterium RIFOXYB1_FULL_47_11]
MAIPKFKPLANAGEGTKKVAKPILMVIIAILLGAFGLEATNNDWDIGKILTGTPVSEAEILRDEKGNLKQDAAGNFITRIMRDKEGNIVKDNSSGGKYTDEYNCDDFTTQPEAQKFYDKAGGVSQDTNRLDGDKDGIACESLPQGAQ